MSKLKIGLTPFQPILPKQAKKEKAPDAEVSVIQQMTDSKQALKEMAQSNRRNSGSADRYGGG